MKKVKNVLKELESLDILYKATENSLLRGDLVKGIVKDIMIDNKDSYKPERVKYTITDNRSVVMLLCTPGIDDRIDIDEAYFKENPYILDIGAHITQLTLIRRSEEYFKTTCYDLEMDIEFSKNSPDVTSLITIVEHLEESSRGNFKGTPIAFGLKLPELVSKSRLTTRLNIRKAIETYMYDQKFKELDIELHNDSTELYIFYRMYPDLEEFCTSRRKYLSRPIDSGERLVLTPSDITDYGQGVRKTIPVIDKK